MKTTLRKAARISLILFVPLLFATSCQEDITEPQSAKPPKDKIVIPK